MTLIPLISALATSAVAQSAPMTAEEFDAYTRGKTLTYATEGNQPYGAEEYLPNRRARWAFNGEECQEGEWFPAGDMICFLYEDSDGPSCWTFFLTPNGLRAEFGENSDDPLYEIAESDEPLFCPGPSVGV
ncbi:MAG: hypothetical protein AAF092_01690 [Pseudomonadota bacterium]